MRSIRLLALACLTFVVMHMRPVEANSPPRCTTDGQSCSFNGDCCSNFCNGGTCGCNDGTVTTCTANSQCCSGLVCNGSSHYCTVCGAPGADCARSSDCCGGFICFSVDHTCQQCSSAGSACGNQSDCCGGYVCANSACCIPAGVYDEGDPANCCSGETVNNDPNGFCKNVV